MLTVNSEENNDDLHVYLLEAAFSYFNQCFKTSLRVNYNYKGHDSGDSEVEKILNAVALERKITSKKVSMAIFKFTPDMKVLTKRHLGNSRELKCPPEHGAICYCGPQRMFRHRFFGSNIYAIFAVKEKVKCFLCDEEIEAATLHAHFQNDCYIFNP